MKLSGEFDMEQLNSLETERLYLRQRQVTDAADIFSYASLPEVSWPAGFPPVETVEAEEYYLNVILPKRIKEQNLPPGYAISLKEKNRVIGSIDFNRRLADDVLEVGYVLHPSFWGQGIITEAFEKLLEVGFDILALHKIEIETYDYNIASRRVAEKLGFTLESQLRDRKDAQGNRCDFLRYGLLREEWRKS